jgi:hypothetical protein
MYSCKRCGKSLLDIIDLLLLFLIAANLIFAILILMMGSWFGLGSIVLVLLFGAGFIARRRECKACRARGTPSEAHK